MFAVSCAVGERAHHAGSLHATHFPPRRSSAADPPTWLWTLRSRCCRRCRLPAWWRLTTGRRCSTPPLAGAAVAASPPVADLQTTAAWMLSTCPVGGAANLRVAGSDTHTVPAGPTAAERVDGEPGQSHAAPRGCRCNTDLRHSWCAAARRRCYGRGTRSRRSSGGSFSSPVRRDASQQARVADASVRTRSSSRADFRVVE